MKPVAWIVAAMVAVAAVLAPPVRAFEIIPDEPLTEEQAQELVALFVLLQEVREVSEEGRDPVAAITGRTPLDLIQSWIARGQPDPSRLSPVPAKDAPVAGGAVDAGGGFYVSDARVRGGPAPLLIGEVENRSGDSYEGLMFRVELYDDDGALLGTTEAAVIGLQAGASKTFRSNLDDVDPDEVASYSMQFEGGY